MARTTAGQYQSDVETYFTGTLGMTQYPSDFDSVAQVLAPGVEYFSVFVNQSQATRAQDSNPAQPELQIRLQLFYRFVTNEAEYTGSGTTPTKHKAALALLMDDKFWRGKGGSFTLTPPLDVQSIAADPVAEITRTGRVIETEITLTLVTTSV